MNWLHRAEVALVRVERIFAGAGLALLTGLVFAQVVFRITGVPVPWTMELARYTMLWTCLLGAVLATASARHINIGIAERYLGPKAKRIVLAATSVFAGLLCLYLARIGLYIVWDAHHTGEEATVTKLPFWTVKAALPACLLLMALHLGVRAAEAIGGVPPPSGGAGEPGTASAGAAAGAAPGEG